MRRFYITQISASGNEVKYSSVSFKDGVNFIVGPSNTGKSYVIGCIDFMFGGRNVPFSRSETGYDTVSMTLESDDGYVLNATRKIEEGKTGDKGSDFVRINTTIPDIDSTELKLSNNEYSDLLLKLMGIENQVKIIVTQAPKDRKLTIRTLFHFFFVNEDSIIRTSTAFDAPVHPIITASLTSLLYMINGDDLRRYLPKDGVSELEKRAIQKAGVIYYLNKKISDLSEQKKKLEESVAGEDIDIEKSINDLIDEIDKIEKEIVDVYDERKGLQAQIEGLDRKLHEARYLSNSYKDLHSQYISDIKRLDFIVDGYANDKMMQRKPNCPFCGHTMDTEESSRGLYVESAKAELSRIKVLLEDLEITESDTSREIEDIENKLKTLSKLRNNITQKVDRELRPHVTELRQAVAKYKHIIQLRQTLQAVSYMSCELGSDVLQKENEKDETATKFDAKKAFDKDKWKALSNQINGMIKECDYIGKPESYLSIDTADVVVGGHHKKNQGKGYRAFLNTLMLFNLLKYLETAGKYSLHILVLDSPILSLKEKKYDITEKDKVTTGMRESLIQYLINNCGNNQVIIAENELPENVDYTKANLIAFSMEEGEGLRYGFLESVRN